MSKHSKSSKVTLATVLKAKTESRKLAMVTCYDAAFAKLISQTDIDMVLVGDSMGNVVLGYDDTIAVTMDMMAHHCGAVARQLYGPLLVADMPFMSYSTSREQALTNAARLMQEGRAHAVKLEGGAAICPTITAIVAAGVPVMGHLGLTPQHIHNLSGFRVQGRGQAAGDQLMQDAVALQEAGCFAIVLELVPEDLAAKITAQLKIPVIGIGAGAGTDGQVLVLHDLLGFDDSFQPKFLKRYANLGETVTAALNQYAAEVKGQVFPAKEHSFQNKDI